MKTLILGVIVLGTLTTAFAGSTQLNKEIIQDYISDNYSYIDSIIPTPQDISGMVVYADTVTDTQKDAMILLLQNPKSNRIFDTTVASYLVLNNSYLNQNHVRVLESIIYNARDNNNLDERAITALLLSKNSLSFSKASRLIKVVDEAAYGTGYDDTVKFIQTLN